MTSSTSLLVGEKNDQKAKEAGLHTMIYALELTI